MGIDAEKMRKRAEEREAESGFGGTYYKFKQGQTLCYVCPPSEGYTESELTDGYPYLEVVMHYNVGPNKRPVPSLSQALLQHPALARSLAARKKGGFDPSEVTEDPVADALAAGTLSDECVASSRYYWSLIPWAHRESAGKPWQPLPHKPVPLIASITMQKGLEGAVVEAQLDAGLDITDPEAAVFVVVDRKGTDKKTKYDVKLDTRTSRKPEKLPADVVSAVQKAIAEGGSCNLFRIAANNFKSPDKARAIVEGIETDDDDEERTDGVAVTEAPADEAPPEAGEGTPDDELEVEHAAGEGGEAVEEAAVDDDGEFPEGVYDDGKGGFCDADGNPVDRHGTPIEPPAPPKPKAPPKPPPKPAAAPPKPAAAPPKPATAGKPAPKAPPKAPPPAAEAAGEGGDDGLDAIEAEIESLSRKPPPKPPTKPAAAPPKAPPKAPPAAAAKAPPKPAPGKPPPRPAAK